jgi:hypothetical protein
MNEQMMVFSKEWFEKHNKTLCWFANAPIIKYWFRWLLRINKDIPWNEKIDEIMPNAFTYGKKLVLVDCVKLKNGEEVFNHSKKLHRKLKNKGLLVKRLRCQQTTDFRTHDKFSKRLYYGLKPLWYILHFMDWAMLDRCEELSKLSFGFSTLTQYPGTISADNPVDGRVERSGVNESLGSIYTGAGVSYNYTEASGNALSMQSSTTTNQYQKYGKSIYCYDTSSIDDNATISAVDMFFYKISHVSNFGINDYVITSLATPASTSELQASDYNQVKTQAQDANTYMFGQNVAYYTNGQYNSCSAVTSSWLPGFSEINKTGITKFGMTYLNGWTNTTTGYTWRPNAESNLVIYFANQTGTTNDPKLIITYTTVSAPTVTTQSATNIAQTTCTGNGNITATGGENCTRRGFCYKVGTSGDPTTSDSVAYDDGSFGTGAFTKSITGLSPNTSYRVRAYAVNSAGTSYGTTVDVKTLSAFKPRTMWFN